MKNKKSILQKNNNLKTINPATFNGLSSLRILNLTKNNLKSIDSALFKELRLLQILDLDDNFLTEIFPFSGLNSLEGLYISHNKIKKILK